MRRSISSARPPVRRMIPCAALLAVASLQSCASWGPAWSELSGERVHLAIADRRPAIPVAIGDRRVSSPPYKTEPGTWTLVLQSPPHDGFVGTEKSLRLAMAPCKRYYVNAQFASPIGPQWTPVIDHVEDIAGCRPAAGQ